MSEHSYLVTGEDEQRWNAWEPTAVYANWIEGRRAKGRATAETWLVTCFDESRETFLAAAKNAGVTVEEIEGTDDQETYKLLVGEPGTGWAPGGDH